MQTLSYIVIAAYNDLINELGSDLDVFLEADWHESGANLLNSRLVEAEIEAVVGQRANFDVLPVVADANDRYFWVLDGVDELKYATAVLVTRHAVHLVHDDAVLVTRHIAHLVLWLKVRVDWAALNTLAFQTIEAIKIKIYFFKF